MALNLRWLDSFPVRHSCANAHEGCRVTACRDHVCLTVGRPYLIETQTREFQPTEIGLMGG